MTIVPYNKLAPDTLRALIEEFVTREGAVHGHSDVPTDSQVAEILRELRAGRVAIVFDHETDSCTICSREELAGRDPDDRRIVDEE